MVGTASPAGSGEKGLGFKGFGVAAEGVLPGGSARLLGSSGIVRVPAPVVKPLHLLLRARSAAGVTSRAAVRVGSMRGGSLWTQLRAELLAKAPGR
jgi:hypothetical protein